MVLNMIYSSTQPANYDIPVLCCTPRTLKDEACLLLIEKMRTRDTRPHLPPIAIQICGANSRQICSSEPGQALHNRAFHLPQQRTRLRDTVQNSGHHPSIYT